MANTDFVQVPSLTVAMYDAAQAVQILFTLVVELNGAGFTSEATDLQVIIASLQAELVTIAAAIVPV